MLLTHWNCCLLKVLEIQCRIEMENPCETDHQSPTVHDPKLLEPDALPDLELEPEEDDLQLELLQC